MTLSTSERTTREIAEEIKRDLNELIYKRGNTTLIAALIKVQGFLNEIDRLERQAEDLQDAYEESWL